MTAALIVAVGKTSGKERFEPEKEVGDITAIERVALTFQRAGIRRIVVVCGGGDRIEKLAANMNLVFLHSPGGEEMLRSVQTGLAYLAGKCTEALITPVDVPLFSAETVRTLLSERGSVRIPAYQGKTGHPLLLEAKRFPEILAYTGEEGLFGAVKACKAGMRLVEVEDEGILSNVRERASYEHLLSGHELSILRPSVRIQLSRERPFYGPGVHQLLQLTYETGSLLEACRQMGISYSKGRKMVAALEAQTGSPAIESRQGGRDGGHSRLTGEALELMAKYEAFCNEAQDCVQHLFEQYFSEEERAL